MLKNFRKGPGRWVVMFFMIILIISFAAWGITDVFRVITRSHVLEIGSYKLTSENFRQYIINELQALARVTGKSLTIAEAAQTGLAGQLLGRLAAEAAIDEQARNYKLSLSDEAIAQEITNDQRFKNTAGQFDRFRFAEYLRSQSLSEAGYIAERRKFALRRQIAESVSAGAFAPDLMLQVLSRYRSEKRTIDYFILPASSVEDAAKPTDEILKGFYDNSLFLFRTVERRNITILDLEADKLAESLAISDADILAFYEQNKARYTTKEKREIQRLTWPSRVEAEAAKNKLNSISFLDLAKEKGETENDISLGLVSREEVLDAAIAGSAFQLSSGAVSDVIEGRFGFSLVKVVKIQPEKIVSFDQVKEELLAELKSDKARRMVMDLHDKIEEARASGSTLMEAAQKAGLKARVVEGLSQQGRDLSGNIVELPHGDDLIRAVFKTEQGVETDALDTPSRGYVWYEVNAITPARQLSFDEAKADVERRWLERERAEKLRSVGEKIIAQVKGGVDFSTVAAEFKLTPQSSQPFTREGSGISEISSSAVASIFSTAKGFAGSALAENRKDRVVFIVKEVETPAYDRKQPALQTLAGQTALGVQDDLLTQYVVRIQKDLKLEINSTLVKQTLGVNDPVN